MTALDQRPAKRRDIKWKHIGKSGILLDLTTGNYFELDEIALTIWQMLDGKKSVAKVVDTLAKKYSCSLKTVEKDVMGFLVELQKRKLIEIVKS